MELGIPLSCRFSCFEVFAISHNQIASVIFCCWFDLLIMVLCHCSGEFSKSLMTEIVNTCHPLNSVLRSSIPEGFGSCPIEFRVIAINYDWCCHLDWDIGGVIAGILCHLLQCFPIVPTIIAIVVEVTLQWLVYSFGVYIGFEMKLWRHHQFDSWIDENACPNCGW
jgi:hypothetical protein